MTLSQNRTPNRKRGGNANGFTSESTKKIVPKILIHPNIAGSNSSFLGFPVFAKSRNIPPIVQTMILRTIEKVKTEDCLSKGIIR